MKTIALFDYFQYGHHLTFLRLFSKTLLEMGYQVMTFCPEPELVSKWIAQNYPQETKHFHTFKVPEFKIPVMPIIGNLPQPLVTLTRWQHTAAVIKKASSKMGFSPDLVFLNWLDSYFSNYLTHQIIERVFPYSWSGIYFHPNNLLSKQHYLPITGTPLIHYGVALSSRCCGIAVLNEMEAKKIEDTIKKPVIIIPDIADESPPDLNYSIAQQICSQAGERKIIGLLGILSKRKGLLTLLEVALQSMQENWFFIFVGPLVTSDLLPQEVARIEEIVNSKPSNCFFHFEHIPDGAPFNALINVCDVLFAAYEDFRSSSNTITKAAVFEKPIIVSDGFCMGERVKKYQLGITIPQKNVPKCIEALHHILEKPNTQNPDFESYRNFHSIKQLRSAFEEICQTIS
ncbi:glycosyltransferase family 1 protein [Iningainema tapete]|uniref:Glycosyltransferase family 1 protein n=1 Tax=Iningainema tapete BLCC-T55 TaxID=2748662 RepID=A0A8J6XTN5_9CYAN|nr:glycosyltransferase family 1 protein [Iningainema tapete]MBD2777366.1 glycosyltransferase family 1 protein [Iningainema tapete BLCC-T55]